MVSSPGSRPGPVSGAAAAAISSPGPRPGSVPGAAPVAGVGAVSDPAS